ncbi:MAG: RHS repeat domain-containing protein [Terracidiphilus sp.]|jgi:YD repeat-containing protein
MFKKIAAVAVTLFACAIFALGQDDPNLEEGIKPYGDFHGGNIDSIDLGSGGLTVAIPIKSFPQRGKLTLPVTLRYNSKLWSNFKTCGGTSSCLSSFWAYGDNQVAQQGNGVGQGTGNTASSPVYITYANEATIGCGWRYMNDYAGWLAFEIIDCTAYSPDGSTHIMAPLYNTPVAIEYQASYPTPVVNLDYIPYKAIDGSGIFGSAAVTNEGLSAGSPVYALGYYTMNRDGIYYGIHSIPSSATEDADGNYISYVPNSGSGTTNLTDSRGLAISTVSNNTTSNGNISLCDSSTPIAIVKAWTVTGQNGLAETYTFCYATLQLQTQFPTYPGTTMNQFKNGTNNNVYALHSVTLPSGDKWVFSYDSYGDITEIAFPTGATISYTYTTLPLCDLSNLMPASNIASFIETYSWTPYSRFVTSRILDANDGTGPHTWQYKWGTEVTTSNSRNFNVTVTDPNNNDTIHTETGLSNSCSFYETSEKEYQGSASNNILLEEVDTNYSSMLSPANQSSWATEGIIDAVNVVPTSITTTTPTSSGNSIVKQVQMDYDFPFQYYYTQWDSTESGPFQGTYGDVSQKREYDWGVNAPGPLLRKTITKYEYDVNSAYANYPGLPYSVQVQDGSGNQVAYTQYGYDEFTPTPSGITTSVLTGIMGNTTDTFPAAPLPSARAHQTSVTKTVLPANTTLRSCNTYFDTGMLASVSDWLSSSANCSGANWTQYSYSSAYAGAYRTQTQKPTTANGVQHKVSGIYDFNSGLLTSFTDENGVVSQYTYNDTLNRMTLAQTAYQTTAERWTNVSYPTLTEIDISQDQNAKGDGAIKKKKIYDGVGRILHDQLTSDTSAGKTIATDTTYDALGRVQTVSNPYRTTSDATYGKTANTYDALGRKILQQNQDNSTWKTWCYNGMKINSLQSNCSSSNSGSTVIATDEDGNQSTSISDGVGRLTTVIEPNGIAQTPAMVTNYIYDPLDNLLSVTQNGISGTDSPRVRTFNYDSLSRLLCSSNPESSSAPCPLKNNGYVAGTIGYSYDGNSNLWSKTDARGIKTSYSYDALNRMISKTYSSDTSGTPVSCSQYDTSSVAAQCPAAQTTGPNWTGRLTNAWTQPSSSACSSSPATNGYLTLKSILCYDPKGRPETAQQQQCVNGKCAAPTPYSLSMAYDLAGNMTVLTNSMGGNGAPLTLTNAYDTAGRLCLATSSWVLGFSPDLFQTDAVDGYAPQGALQHWYYGSTSTTASSGCPSSAPSTNIQLNQGFDNRLRVISEKAIGLLP